LFLLRKITFGCMPTIFISPKVVALGFQLADGQNLG
jgi:hypothetical protein